MPAHDTHHKHPQPEDARAIWESRYKHAPVWSGHVNPTLAKVAADLTPGTALDVGCGEGGDAIWLAREGWQVTGIDLSQTAIDRARVSAMEAGVKVTFAARDITSEPPLEQFELVTGSFLHSPDVATRENIIRAAAALVRPGGRLLLISHATMPPWATHCHAEQGSGSHHTHAPITPESETRLLKSLGIGEWRIERAEICTREASGPAGETATLEDTVLLAVAITQKGTP